MRSGPMGPGLRRDDTRFCPQRRRRNRRFPARRAVSSSKRQPRFGADGQDCREAAMPTELDWFDIALRLALTVAGGAALGIDRSERGRPAGLRTVLLVCLAASLAMLLANRLIITSGKPVDSFVQLDRIRLPLGILTGVGFIGAGTILRREDVVLGVTTAATLWFASVVGLCFGGGQFGLGIAGVGLGILVLSGLRRVEGWLPQDHRAALRLVIGPDAGVGEGDISRGLHAHGIAPP